MSICGTERLVQCPVSIMYGYTLQGENKEDKLRIGVEKMYILFGDKVVDSKEMKEVIEANSDFKVIKDMSRGSKREDILAFNLSVNINTLNEIMDEDQDVIGAAREEITEDDLFDEYLTLAEDMATELEEVVPEGAVLDVRAYKWDKSDNDIKLIIAIAHEELGESKLRDVMKTLIKQVE
jgi:hypothetical protein